MVQWVECACLPVIHEAQVQVSAPQELNVEGTPVIPTLGERKQDEARFKVIFG